jgi:hypothetical protein
MEFARMKIPVLIEITPDKRYRATGCEPLVGNVEGDTPEAVLSMMKQIIDDRVARGARIASIDLPDEDNPWLAGAGMFQDDPLFTEWQQAIADYRLEANKDADGP